MRTEDYEKEALRRRLIHTVASLRPAVDIDGSDALWEQVKDIMGYCCKSMWSVMCRVTSERVLRLLECGDVPELVPESYRMTVNDWLLFDLVLVHNDSDMLASLASYSTVRPLVQIFHMVQQFNLEDCPRDQLAVAWTAATLSYNSQGKHSSPMLLQRRWWELKRSSWHHIYRYWHRNSAKMNRTAAKYRPAPIHIAVARRFPSLMTQRQPRWSETVAAGRIVLPHELERVCMSPGQLARYSAEVCAGAGGAAGDAPGDDNFIDLPEETEDDLLLVEPHVTVIDLDTGSSSDEAPPAPPPAPSPAPPATSDDDEVLLIEEAPAEQTPVKLEAEESAGKRPHSPDSVRTAQQRQRARETMIQRLAFGDTLKGKIKMKWSTLTRGVDEDRDNTAQTAENATDSTMEEIMDEKLALLPVVLMTRLEDMRGVNWSGPVHLASSTLTLQDCTIAHESCETTPPLELVLSLDASFTHQPQVDRPNHGIDEVKLLHPRVNLDLERIDNNKKGIAEVELQTEPLANATSEETVQAEAQHAKTHPDPALLDQISLNIPLSFYEHNKMLLNQLKPLAIPVTRCDKQPSPNKQLDSVNNKNSEKKEIIDGASSSTSIRDSEKQTIDTNICIASEYALHERAFAVNTDSDNVIIDLDASPEPTEETDKSKETVGNVDVERAADSDDEVLYIASDSEEGERGARAGGGGGSRTPTAAETERKKKPVQLQDIWSVRREREELPAASISPLVQQNRIMPRPPRPHYEHPVMNRPTLNRILKSLASRPGSEGKPKVAAGAGPYCCSARRHRALNDARRRLLLRKPRRKLLTGQLNIHTCSPVACNCCCKDLLEQDDQDGPPTNNQTSDDEVDRYSAFAERRSSGDKCEPKRQSSDDKSEPKRQSCGDKSEPKRQSSGDKSEPKRQSSGDKSEPKQQSFGDKCESKRQSSGDKSEPKRQSSGDKCEPKRQCSGDKSEPKRQAKRAQESDRAETVMLNKRRRRKQTASKNGKEAITDYEMWMSERRVIQKYGFKMHTKYRVGPAPTQPDTSPATAKADVAITSMGIAPTPPTLLTPTVLPTPGLQPAPYTPVDPYSPPPLAWWHTPHSPPMLPAPLDPSSSTDSTLMGYSFSAFNVSPVPDAASTNQPSEATAAAPIVATIPLPFTQDAASCISTATKHKNANKETPSCYPNNAYILRVTDLSEAVAINVHHSCESIFVTSADIFPGHGQVSYWTLADGDQPSVKLAVDSTGGLYVPATDNPQQLHQLQRRQSETEADVSAISLDRHYTTQIEFEDMDCSEFMVSKGVRYQRVGKELYKVALTPIIDRKIIRTLFDTNKPVYVYNLLSGMLSLINSFEKPRLLPVKPNDSLSFPNVVTVSSANPSVSLPQPRVVSVISVSPNVSLPQPRVVSVSSVNSNIFLPQPRVVSVTSASPNFSLPQSTVVAVSSVSPSFSLPQDRGGTVTSATSNVSLPQPRVVSVTSASSNFSLPQPRVVSVTSANSNFSLPQPRVVSVTSANSNFSLPQPRVVSVTSTASDVSLRQPSVVSVSSCKGDTRASFPQSRDAERLLPKCTVRVLSAPSKQSVSLPQCRGYNDLQHHPKQSGFIRWKAKHQPHELEDLTTFVDSSSYLPQPSVIGLRNAEWRTVASANQSVSSHKEITIMGPRSKKQVQKDKLLKQLLEKPCNFIAEHSMFEEMSSIRSEIGTVSSVGPVQSSSEKKAAGDPFAKSELQAKFKPKVYRGKNVHTRPSTKRRRASSDKHTTQPWLEFTVPLYRSTDPLEAGSTTVYTTNVEPPNAVSIDYEADSDDQQLLIDDILSPRISN